MPEALLQLSNADQADSAYREISKDALEMANLKTRFDIDRFTVSTVGPFPAHQFHMLMRQYSLTLLELRRLYTDREKLSRRCKFWVLNDPDPEDAKAGVFPDLELRSLGIQIDSLQLSIKNKEYICQCYEEIRRKLMESNDGKGYTNEQYQAEEPEYWKWYFQNLVNHYQLQASTGVPEGVWKNLGHMQSPPVIDGIEPVLLRQKFPNSLTHDNTL